MFLKLSEQAHKRGKELISEQGQQRGGKVLEDALHVAWDRLGPESEYERFGRKFRSGVIEVRDIETALENSTAK